MTEKLISTPSIAGIGPRLLSAADRLAPTAGVLNGLVGPFFKKSGGGLGGATSLIINGVKSFKFASPLATTRSALNQPDVYPIESGVVGIIGGMIADELGKALGGSVGGFLSKAGGASTKFGTSSAFMGTLTAYFLEQGSGGGAAEGIVNVGQRLAGGGGTGSGGQDYRLAQDNPNVVPNTMTQGVVSVATGTEF